MPKSNAQESDLATSAVGVGRLRGLGTASVSFVMSSNVLKPTSVERIAMIENGRKEWIQERDSLLIWYL